MRTGVSLKEKLLSLIFPARCTLCGKITAGGRRVCNSCMKHNPPQAHFRLLKSRSFPYSVCRLMSMKARRGKPSCNINFEERRRKQPALHRR